MNIKKGLLKSNPFFLYVLSDSYSETTSNGISTETSL